MRTHSFLVINPRSGDDSPTPDELATEAHRRGIAAHVLEAGEDPGEVARAARAERIGVAGGDGSLAAVATIAVESDSAFVCVPYGTRNHFARDLGLDRDDPIGALDAFASPVERRIDVGSVSGRLFMNNVSLGVYAGLVHRREHHRRRGEALARARALFAVARHRHRLRARVNGEDVTARALFVGNNFYELDLFTLGVRARLDEGQLFLWVADGVLPTAWDRRTGAEFRIEVSGGVRAAIDGEPAVLEPPLEFVSLPGGLRVLVPGRSPKDASMHDNPESMRYHDADEQSDRAREE